MTTSDAHTADTPTQEPPTREPVTTYDTPAPISAELRLRKGSALLRVADRSDTVVEVRPTDEDDASDVWAAANTTVEFSGNVLRVIAPEQRSMFRSESIEVTIDLPSGSDLQGAAAAADVRAEGHLGEVEFTVASGDLRLTRTGRVRLDAASGDIVIGQVDGDAVARAASGGIRLGEVHGDVSATTASGRVELGTATGDVVIKAASGRVEIARPVGSTEVRTASGEVHIGRISGGTSDVRTASGNVEVGVQIGTAVYLDVKSKTGRIRQDLDDIVGPGSRDARAEVRASSRSGDVIIRRVPGDGEN